MYTCLIPCQWNSYLCSLDGRTLDGVNLEHDEGLVEQATVYVLIQSSLICAAMVELRQRVVVRRKVNPRNFVLVADVRYALSTVFKEAVE